LVSFALFFPAYDQLRKTEKTLSAWEKELCEKKDEIQRLKKELNDLYTNPETVEAVAREKYGLCKPDEIIYIYNPGEM
jgi:cell division protein FtsB